MFIYLDLFLANYFRIALLVLLEDMDRNSQPVVKIVNIHQSKIDVVKFDGMNNFGIWRYKVMDALTTSNLEDALFWRESQRRFLKRTKMR